MKPAYVYPGTFSPPTYGHFSIACAAAKIFPEVTIICSANPNKKDVWFDPEQCRELWKAYKLPKNVRVMTLVDFFNLGIKGKDIVMIRGLRNGCDYDSEKQVVFLNKEKYGIDKFFYIFGRKKYKKISSSRARDAASKLDLWTLSKLVAPLVVSALLEKVLNVKNVFLVVGKPGGGKSTFLKMMSEINPANVHINTDNFNQEVAQLIKCAQEEIFQKALKDEKALLKLIARPWINILAENLKSSPARFDSSNTRRAGSNVFCEIAYGLQNNKRLYRFVGGKIIYIGCEDEKVNEQRVIDRGTPKLTAFIEKIPGKGETQKIAAKRELIVSYINTDCAQEDLNKKALRLNELISKGGENAYDL